MDQQQIEQLCEEYSAHNMRKLRIIIHNTLAEFGKVNTRGEDTNYAEFLSDANFELVKILKTFDETKNNNVHGYIAEKLHLKMCTVLTRLNRDKRTPYVRDSNGQKVRDENGNAIRGTTESLEAEDENGKSVADFIDSGFDIEKYLGMDEELSPQMEEYLSLLSKLQRKILLLLSKKYKKADVLEILHITSKSYEDNMIAIKSVNNTKYLTKLRNRRRK